MSSMQILTPIDAVKLLGQEMCTLDREVVCIINLRSDNRPVCCNFVSMGTVNESVAHPREILKSAILSNATAIMLIHNHPSGNLTPSKDDTMITDRMLKLGELIGIPILDHIIVGGDNQSYFSFREKGLMKFEHNQIVEDYEKLQFDMPHVAEDIPARRRKGR